MMGNSDSKHKIGKNMTHQQMQQKQLSVQTLKDVAILKSQIDSIWVIFAKYLQFIKSNNPDQSTLRTMNDLANQMLNTFRASCDSHKKKGEKDVLVAVWDYFRSQTQTVNKNDAKLVENWFKYMDATLRSDKQQPQIKLTLQTINTGLDNFNEQTITKLVSGVLGANHGMQNKMNNIQQNPNHYQQQFSNAIKNSSNDYNNDPVHNLNQNDMFKMSGGTNNIQFDNPQNVRSKRQNAAAAAIFSNHPANDDNKGNNKGNDGNPNVEDDDGDVNIKDNTDKMAKMKLKPPSHIEIQKAYIHGNHKNGYLIHGPSTISNLKNQQVLMQYPFPIKFLKIYKKYKGVEKIDVQLAWPYNKMILVCGLSCVEMDPTKVHEEEQKYIAQHKNNKKFRNLGYKTLQKLNKIQYM